MFLFWDDFIFLGEAQENDLSRDYLTMGLFRHFSPVSRLVDLMVADSVADHPWVIPCVLFVLLAGVVASVVWLMVVLHGRTGYAFVGCVVVAPSLTLLQLGNWWTAGVNIMPALIGCYLSFAAMVEVVRGRGSRFSILCWAGAALGVLDYELPMLLIGYLGLWVLLFRDRVTAESLGVLARRTWWTWAGLATICLAAALNYRLNYYDPVPRPSVTDTAHALVRSLVHTLVPTALGFHDPRSTGFSAFSLIVGCVTLSLAVLWLLVTREAAWKGLLFAAAGWLLPTLALVLNRVSIFGVHVVDNVIYFHLPTALFAVGMLEAWRSPARLRGRRLRPPPVARRAMVASAIVVMLGGYAWSTGPTARYQLPEGATPDYVEHARESASVIGADGQPFAVLGGDVPGFVVPGDFRPYNRVGRVLRLTVPDLHFDDPDRRLYRVDDSGNLVPAHIEWVRVAGPLELRLRNAPNRAIRSGNQLCFTSTRDVSVIWALGEPVEGPGLVVRTTAEVSSPTGLRTVVRRTGATTFDRANPDDHSLTPRRPGVLDNVQATSIATLRVKGFDPGVDVCVKSVEVGRLVS
ncbi:hypothetical protein G5V58_20220 [Nocardioides anomalus]|uniref:Transmembrane protein n=1 Tax=Nocardioides anomalus TaxID=2712223 RepID=A0A6G6WHS7_9ACTN|nr:hypothetical protein [Nocardioides anomalus]QIG44794.1 hypothetical protein G5V58_20220 [Nocardioides anomalus]